MNKTEIVDFFRQITRPALSNSEALALAERLRAKLPQQKKQKRQRKYNERHNDTRQTFTA